MAAQIIRNQTITGIVTDADANTYIDCTFNPYCAITGEAITFIGCSFNSVCSSNPPQFIYVYGTGSVLDYCYVADPCTIFGDATVVGRSVFFGSFGPDSNILGGDLEVEKPVLNTNQKCSTELEGLTDDDVRQFCWTQHTQDDTATFEGDRT
jgi:hypothetical protein